MGDFRYLDGRSQATIDLPTANPGEPRDFFWMNMRKGGDRLWALTPTDGPNWAISAWRLGVPGGLPQLYNVTLENPPAFGNFSPRGCTTDGHRIVIVARDSTAVQPDSLVYFDFLGNHVATFTCSDTPDRQHLQCFYLEHEYYVLSAFGEGMGVKVYDGRGQLIRSFGVQFNIFFDDLDGLGTDGKSIYVVNRANNLTTAIKKYDVRGRFLRTYPAPDDNGRFLTGICFNGRYLIINTSTLSDPV